MSFAHRSVLKEMREKKAKAAKAVERAVSRWRPWAESASSEPAPWPAKFAKGERGITRGVPQVPEDNRWRLGKYAVRADFDGGLTPRQRAQRRLAARGRLVELALTQQIQELLCRGLAVHVGEGQGQV